jgi:hypothetical protein
VHGRLELDDDPAHRRLGQPVRRLRERRRSHGHVPHGSHQQHLPAFADPNPDPNSDSDAYGDPHSNHDSDPNTDHDRDPNPDGDSISV